MIGGHCPTGCGRSTAPARIMCDPCWGRVPTDVQRELYAAWRAYQAADRGGIDAAWFAYRDAYDAAVEAARGGVPGG